MSAGPSPADIQDVAATLLADFVERSGTRRTALAAARMLTAEGDRAGAEAAYRALAAKEPSWSEAWAGLSGCLADGARFDEALEVACRALAIDPAAAAGHYAAGRLAHVPGVAGKARVAHAAALQVSRERHASVPAIEAGHERLAEGNLDEALECYRRAVSRTIAGRAAMRHLAFVWWAKGDAGESAVWTGYAAQAEGAYTEAVEALEQASGAGGPREPRLYLALAESHRRLEHIGRALDAIDRGLRVWPDDAGLVQTAAETLQLMGRTTEALARLRAAVRRGIGGLALKRVYWLMVPVVYDRPQDVLRYRRRYDAGLARLTRATDLTTDAGRREARRAVLASVNVYLAYQGQDDRRFAERLGSWMAGAMRAAHPDLADPPEVPVARPGERIRVGYASADCRRHSTANTHLGWLRYADRTRFEIFCYHLGEASDVVTEDFRRFSDRFRHLPRGLEAAAAIRADRLHVLVYFDVGLHPRVTALAALRLAPVQATTWGHPVTSGYPTIDYYLSAAGMETPDADARYSEHLVRLPGAGVSYERPSVPGDRAPRQIWGLSDDDVLYFCGQSPYKYLPQYDELLVEIARRVPRARLLFLNTHPASQRVLERIARAFAASGGRFEDSCVVLPRLAAPECLRLMTAMDVFLDTPGWSGANTTYEAMAAGLPVVTWPGPWMRGRHSLAILEAACVTDTVAAGANEYVDLAVRLGCDRVWRAEVAAAVRRGSDRLWSDRTCVRALEELYERVAREPHGRAS